LTGRRNSTGNTEGQNREGQNREGLIRGRLRPHRFVGYAMLLILAVGIVEVVASTLFYEAIDRQSVQEDHARRVAELLVVSHRVHDLDPGLTAGVMSTHHLHAATAATPSIRAMGKEGDVADIRRRILKWEPDLARQTLLLDIERKPYGSRDLVGAMRLDDETWLNFRSRDISTGWPIALRAMVMTLLITLIAVGVGVYALRVLTAPLRKLSEAAETLSHGQKLAPIRESGPADLRNLARSFNDMQARIAGLEEDQARSFEAISHDLRTPLSRLKLASDFMGESEIAKIVSTSADEMEALLMSLQRFLRAQHLEGGAPEPVDLVPMVRDMLAPLGEQASLIAPAQAPVTTWREPLAMAVQPLIDNALHHGTRAEVRVGTLGDRWMIEIADDGPGLAEEYFERVRDPFFRVDEARPRDTAGFGLGIPTAHQIMERFGGKLEFRNDPAGGFIARLIVPEPGDGDVAGSGRERRDRPGR